MIATNGAEAIRVTAAGNVGIGCSSPSAKLSVSGNVTVEGDINASGLITASQAVTCSSDERFKKDIVTLSNALNNVMKISGVTYFWKVNEFPDRNFNDKKQIGFIAQKLEKVYPEMVFTDKDGYKSVDYAKLTAVLVEAMKEQQKMIDKQLVDLKILKGDVDFLKDQIKRLDR